MEEGRGQGCLATSRQHGNALLGVRYQEEEEQEQEDLVDIGTSEQRSTYSIRALGL